MKKYFTILLAALFALNTAYARVLTVSNQPGVKAQYTQISAAIAAASTGDKIFVHPSNVTYANFSIDRQVHIIGMGYNPDFPNSQKVQVNAITMYNAATNAIIEGVYFTYMSNYSTNHKATNNFTVRFCNFDYININGLDWNIHNNIVRNYINFIIGYKSKIQNNIFTGISSSVRNNTASGTEIRNNVFTGCSNCDAFSSVSNATISNNIFYGKSPAGASSSAFLNNLTYQTEQNDIPYDDNIGSDNIVNDNPEFVSAPTKDNFNYTYNYQLEEDSPGKEAGTDDTDLGVFGGNYQWLEHVDGTPDYTGQPYFPFIKSFDIINNTLDQRSKLHFEVEAVKKD